MRGDTIIFPAADLSRKVFEARSWSVSLRVSASLADF